MEGLVAVSLKVIYGFSLIPTNVLITFFAQTENHNPKIHMQAQKSLGSQSNWNKKDDFGSNTMPYCQLSLRSVVTKPAWYRAKRNVHKPDRIGDLEIKPHSDSYLNF